MNLQNTILVGTLALSGCDENPETNLKLPTRDACPDLSIDLNIATKERIQTILDEYVCEFRPVNGQIYYQASKKDPEWELPAYISDFSSFRSGYPECKSTIKSFESQIDSVKPVCDRSGNIINLRSGSAE